MAPYPTGTCANCTNHGVLKYARRTMCTRYKCQKAATAEREKRIADGGGDDAVVPTYCFEIKEVIGMRFADPERLVGKKRRNELAAAETSLCYLTRGKFGEDQNDDGSKCEWVGGCPFRNIRAVPRERLRVSAPQAGPVAGVLNVLRTHSQPCHSDPSRYLGNSDQQPHKSETAPEAL